MRRHQGYAARILQKPRRGHMEATSGKLQLVIRSKRVSRLVEFEVPLMTSLGKVGVEKKRAIVYDYVLDEGQKQALNEARKFAVKQGLSLQVTDISRQSLLRRTVASGLEGIGRHMWLRSSSWSAGPKDAGGIEVKNAMLSVADKSGLVDLAKGLRSFKVSLLATGGNLQRAQGRGFPWSRGRNDALARLERGIPLPLT